MATKNNLIARLMDRAKKSEKEVAVFTLKDLDIDITLEEPSNELVNDAFEYKDGEKGDQLILYTSIIEPNFKELGKQLKDDGAIGTPIDVVDYVLKPGEIRYLAGEAVRMAGYGDDMVARKKVDEVKN